MEDTTLYQALYRVWRPKTFSDMVGQEAIVRTLRNQVNTGRIAHAYLFCGSRGTGKTSAARILTRAINCQNPRNGDPCGECASCQMIESGTSFDVYEMDAASNSRVEEIRELLEKVDYPPRRRNIWCSSWPPPSPKSCLPPSCPAASGTTLAAIPKIRLRGIWNTWSRKAAKKPSRKP